MARFSVAFAFVSAVICSAIQATASPTAGTDNVLEVFDPLILVPNATTVWHVNDKQNVTWDTSTIPPGTPNFGQIVLRAAFPSPNPFPQRSLATGFLLTDGIHEILVPGDLETRDDYMIILFGDSGNTSPAFTIIGDD